MRRGDPCRRRDSSRLSRYKNARSIRVDEGPRPPHQAEADSIGARAPDARAEAQGGAPARQGPPPLPTKKRAVDATVDATVDPVDPVDGCGLPGTGRARPPPEEPTQIAGQAASLPQRAARSLRTASSTRSTGHSRLPPSCCRGHQHRSTTTAPVDPAPPRRRRDDAVDAKSTSTTSTRRLRVLRSVSTRPVDDVDGDI